MSKPFNPVTPFVIGPGLFGGGVIIWIGNFLFEGAFPIWPLPFLLALGWYIERRALRQMIAECAAEEVPSP
jgi:hypothetical protein